MSQFPPSPDQPIAYATAMPGNSDLEHLKILAICHWVWGALELVFSCFFIIYLVMGIIMLNGGFPTPGPTTRGGSPAPEEWMGWFFVAFGGCAVTFGWICGALTIWSGFHLRKHRKRTFSIVIAAINCLSMPIGTILGIFTIIVLVRDSVKRLYEQDAAQAGAIADR